MKICSEIGQK